MSEGNSSIDGREEELLQQQSDSRRNVDCINSSNHSGVDVAARANIKTKDEVSGVEDKMNSININKKKKNRYDINNNNTYAYHQSASSSSFGNDYDADYFGNDDRNTSKDDDDINLLSWRLDPEESLSDWTLVITGQNNNISNTYHVHKNILAVGPCKSDYFVSLFRNSHRYAAECNTQSSYIVLEDMAANVFTVLLDFMYSPVQELTVSTDNAVALRYLAQYFGIKLLHNKVMKFVNKDIKNLDTVSTYIQGGELFSDERMLSLAADKIAESIQNIDTDSSLLKSIIDPAFFLRIVSSSEIDTCDESSHLSVLIASYCNIHKNEMDYSMFRLLTGKNHMPLIHRDAALPLLKLETHLLSSSSQQQQTNNNKNNDHADDNESATVAVAATTTGTTTTTTDITCLQRRCIKVLALYWKDNKQDVNNAAEYKALPSNVLAELLEKSLSVAKQNSDDIKHRTNIETTRLINQYDEKIKSYHEVQKTKIDEYNKLKRESSDKIAALKSIVAERDRQMAEYEKVLSKFKRVPVTHSFRPLSQSTYHHLSGNSDEPFDGQLGVNEYDVYGRIRPNTLPPHNFLCGGDNNNNNNTEDGYIYTERKAGKMHYDHYPVYYYKDD